jgi:long-chain acyl-CoA synthetase
MIQRVDQLIRDAVERWPSNVAIVQGELHWTYADLARRALCIREQLTCAGLNRGDRVVIWLDNSAEYIATYFAVLDLGGIVVALHPKFMTKEVVRTIHHVGATALVTVRTVWDANSIDLKTSGLGFVLISGELIALDESDIREKAPDHIAQIIYTSGTTGQPKGVMLSHLNLIANMRSILNCLHLMPEDSIVAVLPFVFVYGNSVMLTHLFSGGKLVIENNLIYPQVLVNLIRKEKITGFSGVASHYAFLLRQSDFHAGNQAALRYFTCAGGPMPAELLRKVLDAFPTSEFHVMYGQTEATARLTMLPPADLERKKGSAGLPVPGNKIKIVKEDGIIASPGEIGEILVEGDNVMQGYWRDPEASSRTLKDGALHTGDLGYLDEDGYVFITGRNSEMIKSGAFRISPNEIEDVLYQHPYVYEAGVVGAPDDMLGEKVIALVVPKAGVNPEVKALSHHCARHLPPYKRPKVILLVDELPKSANGKILRPQLRELCQTRLALRSHIREEPGRDDLPIGTAVEPANEKVS